MSVDTEFLYWYGGTKYIPHKNIIREVNSKILDPKKKYIQHMRQRKHIFTRLFPIISKVVKNIPRDTPLLPDVQQVVGGRCLTLHVPAVVVHSGSGEVMMALRLPGSVVVPSFDYCSTLAWDGAISADIPHIVMNAGQGGGG